MNSSPSANTHIFGPPGVTPPSAFAEVMVDRSRIAAFRDCPRYRYLRYHAGEHGGGWAEGGAPPLPLAFGTFLHEALARTWKAGLPTYTGEELATLQNSIEATTGNSYEAVWDFTVIAHQLLQQWATLRLPVLRATYDLVSIEPTAEWAPLTPTIGQWIRPDALVRDRLTGGLYYLEFKTSSVIGASWQAGWERNMQFLSNIFCLETLLQERVAGVIVEGLQRGKWNERARVVNHPFVTIPNTSQRLQPLPVEMPTDEREWRDALSQLLPPTTLALSSVPPIRPSDEQVQRWHTGARVQESRVAFTLQQLSEARAAGDATEHTRLLNSDFPCHEDHCANHYGRRCEFDAVCWTGASAKMLFVPRTPHHTGEVLKHAEALK